MSPRVGNLSDTFYFFKMWFHELTMGSHLRRQISYSFLVHQGKARTPQDTLAPMEGAEPAATAVRRMCYRGSHQPDPNATSHQAYLQEMLGPCCSRGWGDTKINVKDAKPMQRGAWSIKDKGWSRFQEPNWDHKHRSTCSWAGLD